LLDLAAFPGSKAIEAIAVVTNNIAVGKVPPVAREFIYGARLAALEKSDGGLRPIAAGDVFRRLAGRLLARSPEVKGAETELLDARQIGVRTPCGQLNK
jgi:hypothetical protein